MQTPVHPKRTLCLLIACASFVFGSAASAQDLADVLLEEIIVTATKRAGGIDVQRAAVAVTAVNAQQMDAMHMRDLQALGFSAPSVKLEDIGTTRGYANFTIRGLGINSSIPTIDPTVGVFVDGVYLGVPTGVVLDMFDLESVEMLRGPQGILFGRNVTGGAVLLNTTRPGDELRINARVAAETGDNVYASGVLSGPLGDTFGAKLAVYYNDNGGWHTNLAGGADHGAAEMTIVRGALEFTPTDSFDIILRLEHGEAEGDGPASRNDGCVTLPVPGLCPRQYELESFEFAIDERGLYDNEWDQAIIEFNWDIGFGDGQITNIFGWRDLEAAFLSDIDATPVFLFHAPATTDQDQISNELRYNGTFGNTYLTTGIYYFTQDIEYIERRIIPPVAADITGGGTQTTDMFGVFAQLDIEVNDLITFNVGGRFTREEKDASVATIPLNLCQIGPGCSAFDFSDKHEWTNFAPKLGVQLFPSEETMLYAFWTQGFRSGGYNMRHTAVAIPNERFDEEEQRSFEVGVKTDLADGTVRVNAAGYFNKISDMQRELNLADPIVGVVQLIRNTADARISGVDAEVDWAMTDSLFLKAHLGYVDGAYEEVRFDLNGDGVIDRNDLNLDIPRLSPWTYGAELIFQHETNWGSFTAQVSGQRRDAAAYTDNNLGQLYAMDMFNARVSLGLLDDRVILSVFGRNLKDEASIGGDTQLPFFPGATFSPLGIGRTYGVELQWVND